MFWDCRSGEDELHTARHSVQYEHVLNLSSTELAGDAFSWNRSPFNFQAVESIKKLESESNYLFDWNLIMAWNQNQFHVFALESESI